MKHGMKKRGLSLFLSVLMVITAVPLSPLGGITANAAEKNLMTAEPMVISQDTTLTDVQINGGTGQSAVVIDGNVTLTIEGTVRLTGGRADYGKGAGAGIEVPAGSSLTLKGSGTLYATGGSAADGEDAQGLDEYKDTVIAGGRGGGGAGAGIGGKGSDYSNSSSSVGNIIIADKDLLVNAVGGGGSSTGGKGSDGAGVERWDDGYYVISEDLDNAYVGKKYNLKVKGRYGGAGGGGGGFPAAGIGAGGASGGNGGSNGCGTEDSTSTVGIWVPPFPYYDTVDPGWFMVMGGAGGGGGAGYHPGGGGGAGAGSAGSYGVSNRGDSVIELAEDLLSHEFASKGGEPGKDGGTPERSGYEFKGEQMHVSAPGKAGGKEYGGVGGTGGTAFSGEKRAGYGGNGEDAGKRMAGGQVTLTAGTLNAKSGGGNAQDIGYGDGKGSASSGSLTVKGGSMKNMDYSTPPKNGASQVYPVQLMTAKSDVPIQEVLVNGSDFGVGRYMDDSGKIFIWLPEGTYTAEVITQDEASVLYENFKVKSGINSPSPTLSDPIRLDVSNGDIYFYAGSYKQGSQSGVYGGDAILSDSTNSGNKPNVAYENLDGDAFHKTTLQNVSLGTISVIGEDDMTKHEDLIKPNTDKYARINLIPEGKNNHIDEIRMVDDNTYVKFGGEEDSELTVGSIGMNKDNVHRHRYDDWDYNYISELKLASDEDDAETAKRQLSNAGYQVIDVDLNEKAGGHYVYLGYKTTKDPNQAITDIRVIENGDYPANIYCQPIGAAKRIKYDLVRSLSDNTPDLNRGVSNSADLCMYYTKDQSFYSEKKVVKIGIYHGDDPGDRIGKVWDEINRQCHGPGCFYGASVIGSEKEVGDDEDLVLDWNKGGGSKSKYIYGYMGYSEPVTMPDACKITNEDKHSGKAIMDGKGKVTVQSVDTKAMHTNTGSKQVNRFWGSPSFEVNRGCLVLPEKIRVLAADYWEGSWPIYATHDNGCWGVFTKLMKYTYAYVGSDTIGEITVNGGTLMLGSGGTGDGNIPLVYNSNGEIWNNAYRKEIPAAAAGGNVLMTDGAWNEVCGKEGWITLTGLPADSHMKNILRTDNESICGDFQNQDIWTNGEGVVKTKVTADSHDIIFEDQEGNPYHYRYENGNVTKLTIPAFKDAPVSDAPVRVEEKYVVQGGSIFLLDDADRLMITKNIPGGITVATDRDLTISAKDGATIGNLTAATGKKLNLTIDGSGLTSSGTISADTVKLANTTVEAQAVSGDITLQNGASVKTAEPIKGARNEEGISVYQAVIPKWNDSFTLDGSDYTNIGTAHGDGKLYLYAPADSKKVTVDGTDYSLEYVEDTQTMRVSEIFYGDGKIDLSKDSAVIMDETRYRYGDKVYVNKNGQKYEVFGETTKNTLTVKSDAQIVLTNLTADCSGSKASPMSMTADVSAVITLDGANTLTGGEGQPAIHVPVGSELTIVGSGVLNAKASGTAAAMGGKVYEENGKITIEGGTLNLTADTNAVGAGVGSQTPDGSIVVTGGSVYSDGAVDAFGTAPVNGKEEELSLVVIKPNSAENVKVDGKDHHVNATNTDGKLYLYLLSDRHTVTAGRDDYLVEPVRISNVENGSIMLKFSDSDSYLALADGDMLVEGSVVRISTDPDDGYSLFEGPQTGTYRAEQKEGKLTLAPVNVDVNIYNDIWIPEIQEDSDSGDKGEENKSFTGNYSAEIKGSYTMNLGAAKKGDTTVSFHAMGKGMTAEILINGNPVKSVTLTDEKQELSHSFMSDGTDVVSIRYGGTGKVTMSDLLFGTCVDAGNVTAQFKKTYTLKVPAEFDPDAEDLNGYILLRNSKGEIYFDPNPAAADYQVFEGDTVTAYYVDPDGGSIVDGYIVTYADGTTETVNQSELPLTFGLGHIEQDVTLALQTHLEPYYEIIIPETVAVSNDDTKMEITASELKNMQTGDTLDISVSGLNENGQATLTRVDADNTLDVPIMDKDKNPLKDGDIAAQFTNNNQTPAQGGTIYFGAPVGERKAGEYEGTVTFTIAYQTAGK